MCVMPPAGDDGSLGEFTPSFLWLLRDFYLKLEEENRKVRLVVHLGDKLRKRLLSIWLPAP